MHSWTRRRPWLAIASTVFGALALVAVSPSTEAGNAGDVGAFDWTVGTWEGVRRDGADGTEEPMTMRVEAILGGRGQIRQLEVRHRGGTYHGFAVQIFNPERGVWLRQYANASRGTFAQLEGTVEASGDGGRRSVWRSVTPGRSRESRLVSERPDPNRWRRVMHVSDDGGETWRVLWSDELARVQEGASESSPVRYPDPS